MKNTNTLDSPVKPRVGHVYGLFEVGYREHEECRYIGKTVADLQERLQRDVAAAKRGARAPRLEWIREVLNRDGQVVNLALETHYDLDRFALDALIKKREKIWIAWGRSLGWDLLNDSDGGEGPAINALVRGVDDCTEPGCSNTISCRNLCESHYKRLRLYGSTEERPPRYPPLEERFWSKVDIREENECWEWTASLSSTGYGQFQMGGHRGKPQRATRIALRLSGVDVPDHLHALHRCDNPKCVNPNHLYMGDDADNVRDMYERGRGVTGERHPGSKLTEDDVRTIRQLSSDGMSTSAIAVLFPVTSSAILKIVRRKMWKHVQ